MFILYLILATVTPFEETFGIFHQFSGADINNVKNKYGGDLEIALTDVIKSLPSSDLTIVSDNSIDSAHLNNFIDNLIKKDITTTNFNISNVENMDTYFHFLSNLYNNHMRTYHLFFVNTKLAEHILIEIRERNFIRRSLVYMFYWGTNDFQRYFLRNIHESMRVVLITNPRYNAYRIYYNQATSHRKHHLAMVNWWTKSKNLFNHPTLPEGKIVFKNFKKRLINVPVIHKPPWHFVKFPNDNLTVSGGRDDKLLKLLSEKLNFRFQYEDPPERIQGSSFTLNGSFEGVLGLIWKREYEFFLGDVALTPERFSAVEFSFLTLADSGAFVTHAPATLNEALALIRPFHWRVWPAIVLTLLVSGPILYALIALPNAWQPRFLVRSHHKLFGDCFWVTVSLFLKQSEKEPGRSHKVRFFTVLLSISATYVIGDMYSANLTSLLAKPGREKSINNLVQLKEAMINDGFELYVEKQSSTFGLLENGTGIYGTLWEIMSNTQKSYLVDSVESGVRLVKDNNKVAVIAGRETLFFDIQRFGATNFHLSEKINTAYSAIAFQTGCPYIENINQILMAVFEAGILTKMTEDEYENLGKQQMKPKDINVEERLLSQEEVGKPAKANGDNPKLKAINIKMLQGAFYLLLIGYFVAGQVLMGEIIYQRQNKVHKKSKSKFRMKLEGNVHVVARTFNDIKLKIRRIVRQAFNEAVISTLEYLD